MPVARQLCKASSTVAVQGELTKCPVCGRGVTPTEFAWSSSLGQRERRPVIPSHVRDEQGEARVAMSADKNRYPH